MLILTVSFMLLIAHTPLANAEEAKTQPTTGITIVDAMTNNGSFETGDIEPWAPVCIQVSTMNTGEKYADNIIKVEKDPAFAAKDKSYLSLQAAGDPKGKLICARVDMRNIKGIDLEKGRTFILSWDVRNGEKKFSTPIAEFLALTKAGAVMAKSELLTEAPIVTDKWVTRRIKLVMPDTLKEFDSIHLRIGFATQPTESGATYKGFIDNVTLIQSK